jgi:hypothetical protein
MARIVRPSLLAAAVLLVLSMGTTAFAHQYANRSCTVRDVVGDWAYLKTGTIILPTGAVPFAAVGRITLDHEGNLTGTQDNSVGGGIGKGELRGSWSLEPDCSCTMTVAVHDASSGALLRTVQMAVVFDDGGTELRGIVTSLVLPNGASLPQAITGTARKLFPHGLRSFAH